jgi:hypothetical protein
MFFRKRSKAQGSETSPESGAPVASLARAFPVITAPVLANYTGNRFIDRHRTALLWIFGGALLFYGLVFGVFASFLLPPLLAPIALLLLFNIWLLPDSDRSPAELMGSFLFAYLIGLLVWPDYLALQIPGLPWISAIRMIGIPMVVMLLVCLSVSQKFRSELMEVMNQVPVLWKALLLFAALSVFSVGVSHDPGNSVSKLIIALLYWYSPFFIAMHVFRTPGRVARLSYYLWAILVFDCLISLWENHLQVLPWVGHIPTLLQVNDPNVLKIMSFHGRAADGVYRAQGKFTTSLGLAEYIGMATPFVVFQLLNTKRFILKVAALASFPIILLSVLATGSRLAMISFGLSFVIYMLVWSLQRWRQDKASIFAPGLLLSYPLLAASLIAASFSVRAVRVAVWGGGAAQASTLARQAQVAKGIPMILSHPWGHGIGQAAITLGMYNPVGEISIDSYFLSLGLEFGVIGFLAFMTLFITSLVYCAEGIVMSDDPEMQYMAPLSISMVNFLISKSILSQQENHSLAFLLLGVIGALYYRYQKERKNSGNGIPSAANP